MAKTKSTLIISKLLVIFSKTFIHNGQQRNN